MKTKKIPMRLCIVSREKLPKQELIRVVKTNDNQVIVDISGKINGHGVYLKKDLEVIKRAKETKIIDKYLDVLVPNEIYDILEKEI